MNNNKLSHIKKRFDDLETAVATVDHYVKQLKYYPSSPLEKDPHAVNGKKTVIDSSATLKSLDHGFLAIFGYRKDEARSLRGSSFFRYIPTHMHEYFAYLWRTMIKKYKKTNDESVLTFRINGMHKQGYEVPILVTLSPTENNHFVLNVEDRSYKHRLEEELRASREHFIILAETATEGIVQIKNDFTVQFANKAIKKIFGYTKDELEQRNIGMLFPDSRYKNYVYLIKKYFFIDDQDRETTGLQNSVEVLGKRKDGDVIPLEISFGNSKGIGNEQILTCIIRDISARKKSERRLKYLAYHDKLTSLGNRDRLHQSLDQFLAEVKRSPDRKGALLFLDLDGFKKVNDSLGHEMGDLILKESAKRLSDCLREEDQVYRIQMQDIFRLGGDEFTILLPNIRHYEDAAVVAKRIIDRILEPFHIEGYGSITNINMGVSVGITLIPDDGTDKNTLLKNADTAMYHAKGKGNTYAFFTEEMNNRAFERLMLEEGLRKAIGTDSFKLHYQPIVNRRGEILGLEALIRWNHPEKGLIPPDTFISIAEDTRLILPLGNWVLETAIRHLRMLHDLGYEHLYMGVNVSPLQLERDDLANRVKSILAKMKVDPCYFTLELTETSIMNDPESAITKMNKLINTNKGMRIAIDDFGTGYSSLNYLSRFPINHLKIDKSFVSNMESENNIKIVNAILSLGHSLGLNTIAEGVETREQLDYLITKNCDSFQGYYFKKPLSYETLLTVLKRQYHAAQISKNKQQRQET